MDNETLSGFISQAIDDRYQRNLQLYFLFSSLALLVYASLLSLPDEREHIWKPKFTLPTYLYLSAKYPLFVFLSLAIVVDLAPLSLRLCGVVAIVAQVMQNTSFFGIHGLVFLRTYSLSQGYRPMAVALSLTFLTTLATRIYGLILPSCTTGLGPSFGSILAPLLVTRSVTGILLVALAFSTIIRQVWGLWRLKRSLKLQSNDFLTLLLQQGVMSLCFVLSAAFTEIFLSLFAPIVTTISAFLEAVISTLIICKFTLDLRRLNTEKSVPDQSALSLPTLSFQENPLESVRTVLGRLHESIVAEMGERNDPPANATTTDDPVSRIPGNLENGLDDANSVQTVTNGDRDESQEGTAH